MIRILVVSDSHGYVQGLRRIAEEALKVWGSLDACLHCGDGARDLFRLEDFFRAGNPKIFLAAVRGNCDGEGCSDIPYERTITLGNTRIFMTHGHHLAVKSTLMLLSEDTRGAGCTIGHTHEPCMEMLSALLLNPGCAHMGRYLILELQEDGQPRIHLESLRS